ncbi:MAG TPA: RNA polymerase sigma factor [Acidobacteriaceae bacterium]|jgi:RNA polymerase sigma-70 factor (ECF subfamily)|nr:RNA polymerase sigma factor [Acidobacteriaceae bacterium]
MPRGDLSRRFPDDDPDGPNGVPSPGRFEDRTEGEPDDFNGGGEGEIGHPGAHGDEYPDPEEMTEVPEIWPESPEEGAESVEEAEFPPQPDDPNGVSRDMATVALNPGMLEGSRPARAAGAVAGPADWRAMSDAEIMLRVREGDDSGFDFLIEKYRKPIINFMYRMVHNQAEAEELAQEVFLRVYRSRQTYRAEAKFTTWLYRIATNLGVNHARDTKHERAAQTIYLDQPDPETGTTPDVADMRPGAEVEMVRDERMQAIRKHVMALPERQRTAVLMHKYQGLDYKEIGAVLRLSESATKSLLFRAYQTLREKLKGFVEQG